MLYGNCEINMLWAFVEACEGGMPLARLGSAMMRHLNRSERPRFNQLGFTLLEIMIVVSIIGLTAVMAIPNLVAWQSRYQLRQAMTEISADLNLAKMVAMNRNRQATVTIQLASGLVQVSGTAGGLDIFPTATLKSHVTALPGGTATVGFSSMGLSTATVTQLIQVGNDRGLIYSLSVLPSGKVAWCASSSCP